MGESPCFVRYALVFEKCLQPKNPLYAESGDGCAHSNTKCLDVSIKDFLLRAFPPQRINTTCSFCLEINSITLSVNQAQPHLEWEFAWCSRTDREVFIKSTPSFAHLVKFPLFGSGQPTSDCNSLKIFCKDGGFCTPSCTEKQSPCACPTFW